MTQADLTHARILIVDDQPSNVALLEDILQDGGYTALRSLTDSRQALAAVADYRPDLILLDLMMPFLDGVAVMAQLREVVPADAYLPVLVLTANVTPEAKRQALAAGARDFLTKPFDADEVLLRIRNLLETRFLYLAQQRQAAARIQELADLIDQASDAILVRDLAGRVLRWNRGAERLYGWPAAEAVGKPIRALIYREGAADLDAAERATLDHGAWAGELRQAARDGTAVIVDSRWTLARDADGRPRAFLIINTDVTEKKKTEAQLLRTQRLESIGVLAGGIAHDLNNMLTPLMMGLPLLAAQLPDPTSQMLLGQLEASVERGAALVRQILTFARGTEEEFLPVDLRPLVKEFAKVARQSFPKTIAVHTTLPDALGPVTGNSTQLYQVLMNLAVNARDAMPQGGTLTLAAANFPVDEAFATMQPGARPGPHVVLSIRDTGTGMAPEVLGRIFEPFFTTKDQGTGLGLSVALRIVQRHGGFFQVDSQPGRGTEFRLFLPALRDGDLPAAGEPRPLPHGRGELILVVDDEASVLQITRALLETHGYRVVTAADGIEAVAIYARRTAEIAAVVTDLVMPQMDGATTLRTLQRLAPAVKVIVVSGVTPGGGEAAAPGLGEKAFLRKPFTAEALLATLRDVLRG